MKFKSEDGRYFEIVEIESKSERKPNWAQRGFGTALNLLLLAVIFYVGGVYFKYNPIGVESNQKLTETR